MSGLGDARHRIDQRADQERREQGDDGGPSTGWLIGGAVVVLGLLDAVLAWLSRRSAGPASA